MAVREWRRSKVARCTVADDQQDAQHTQRRTAEAHMGARRSSLDVAAVSGANRHEKHRIACVMAPSTVWLSRTVKWSRFRALFQLPSI